MARLVLQFEGRTIHEYGLGLMVTIGRTPDNTLTINNPAISSHHACVFREGEQFVLEDLQSTNGTFVNQKRISRYTLRHGDAILIGKHTLVFEDSGNAATIDAADRDEPTLAALGDTVFLDTRQHRALLASLTGNPVVAPSASATERSERAVPPAPARATLRVVSGRTDCAEYTLDGHTSLIGRSDAALVRLPGWFAPPVAVAIVRGSQGYTATRVGGRATINGRPLTGRRELIDGDVLRVGRVSLEFSCGRPGRLWAPSFSASL